MSTLSNYPGLSRRETFAALAMQGLLAGGHTDTPQSIAVVALSLADALQEELNKEVCKRHAIFMAVEETEKNICKSSCFRCHVCGKLIDHNKLAESSAK